MPLGDTVITDPLELTYTRQSGFTLTQLDQFTNGSHPKAVASQVPGQGGIERLISIDTVDDVLLLRFGFGTPVLDVITPRPNQDEFGLEWEETDQDMYTTAVGGLGDAASYRYDGFSSTQVDTLDLSSFGGLPTGCTWKEDVSPADFIFGMGASTNKYFLADGYTSTILDSISAVTTEGVGGNFGCYWDETDDDFVWVQQLTSLTDRIVVKQTGFTSTINDSLNFGTTTFGFDAIRGVAVINSLQTGFEDIGVANASDVFWPSTGDAILMVDVDAADVIVFGEIADLSPGFFPGTPVKTIPAGAPRDPSTPVNPRDPSTPVSPRDPTDVDPREC